MRTIFRYDQSGKYLGEFNPNLPKDQLPKFKTGGVQWAPVALAFAPDGTMYVTEILNGHRLLIFGPTGSSRSRSATLGHGRRMPSCRPGLFQFPNGIAYHKGLVYVTDSNNRRVQVFDKDGNFKKIIVTQGLPRGIAFLNRFPFDKATAADRFVVVDTLAHDGTIWTAKGDKILSFGQQGFSTVSSATPTACPSVRTTRSSSPTPPTAASRSGAGPTRSRRSRFRRVPNYWPLCLAPLLLLPLLLLLRRKRFFATQDFVLEMVESEQADLMRRRPPEVARDRGGLRGAQGHRPGRRRDGEAAPRRAEYSESDARALMEQPRDRPADRHRPGARAARQGVLHGGSRLPPPGQGSRDRRGQPARSICERFAKRQRKPRTPPGPTGSDE